MKKAANVIPVKEVAPVSPEEPAQPEVPVFGFGKFEYRDQSTY